MSDSELMAIIGHEIGHVARTDTKDTLKNALPALAAQNAAGSVSGSVAARLSESQLAESSGELCWRRPSIRRSRNTTPTSTDSVLPENNVDPYAMYRAR